MKRWARIPLWCPCDENYLQAGRQVQPGYVMTPTVNRRGRSTRSLPSRGNVASGRISLVCGVDLVDLADFSRDLQLGGDGFLGRIYTRQELSYCRDRRDRLAARFAAKEAIAKALGTGIRGLNWREIEVVSCENGLPRVVLHGRAQERAKALRLSGWALSLSHTQQMAIACVIAFTDGRFETNEDGT